MTKSGFTHGCSVDHIIFDFDASLPAMQGGSRIDARARFDITLENAEGFRREARAMGASFKPLGVIQGLVAGEHGRGRSPFGRNGI